MCCGEKYPHRLAEQFVDGCGRQAQCFGAWQVLERTGVPTQGHHAFGGGHDFNARGAKFLYGAPHMNAAGYEDYPVNARGFEQLGGITCIFEGVACLTVYPTDGR